MKKFPFILCAILLFCICDDRLLAQCDFDPFIENGEVILCPGGSETLTTQSYDAYQWYRRAFSEPEASPIPGATDSVYTVTSPNDVVYYFSVEATLDGCSERSPEVLVDQWAFLPVVVETSGEFGTGQSGQTILCNEDTARFRIMLPYDTLIQWYKDNSPIPGANDEVLEVTEGGTYWVTGAPSLCPDFQQGLGVSLEVIKKDIDAVAPQILPLNDTLLTVDMPGQFSYFLWYRDDTALWQQFGQNTLPLTTPGSYRVFTHDLNGCPEFSAPYEWVTSTREPYSAVFQLYPNPSSGAVFLEFSEPVSTGLRWEIYDLAGRKLRSGAAPAGSRRLRLSTELPQSGMYQLLLRDLEGKWIGERLILRVPE